MLKCSNLNGAEIEIHATPTCTQWREQQSNQQEQNKAKQKKIKIQLSVSSLIDQVVNTCTRNLGSSVGKERTEVYSLL